MGRGGKRGPQEAPWGTDVLTKGTHGEHGARRAQSGPKARSPKTVEPESRAKTNEERRERSGRSPKTAA